MKITCHEAETSPRKVLLNTRVFSVTASFFGFDLADDIRIRSRVPE